MEPTNYNILLEMGILELALGDYSSSIENLTKAGEYAPTDFDKCGIFSVLSEAYRMKEMVGKSEYYLKKSNQISGPCTETTLEWLRGLFEEKTNGFPFRRIIFTASPSDVV